MRKLLATLLLCCGIAGSVAAKQEEQFRFDVLTTASGLSSSSVSGITQDGSGFLWFATQTGLDRYDGQNFTVFESRPFHVDSLAHSQIQTIYADPDGTLWIGTYGGLSHFDPSTNRFRTYAHDSADPSTLSNNVVVAISRDSQGRLWVGTLDGLNRLDESTGSFTHYAVKANDPRALPNSVVRAIKLDRGGTLWIGTYGGLSRYNSQSDDFTTWNVASSPKLGSNNVMTITEDPKATGVLWIGTWDGGLCRLDTKSGAAELFRLPDARVYTILIDSADRIWIGTWGGGLLLFEPESHRILQYTAAMPDSVPNDVIYSLYQDSSGVLWIGTNGGGLAKLVAWENRYSYIRENNANPDALPEGKVTAIAKDSSGEMWYGVYNAGLHRLVAGTNRFVHYLNRKNDPSSLSNDIINSLFVDRAGRLWVTTNGGIDLYDRASDSFRHPYANDPNFPIKDSVITDYFQDSRGSIWIGTYTDGLYRFDSKMREYVHYSTTAAASNAITDNFIRMVYEDTTGDIWVGTNNGLNRYTYRSDSMTQFGATGNIGHSISQGNVTDIQEGGDGRIYISTRGGGVSIYHRGTGEFTYLTTDQGLSSNMVSGILQHDAILYFITGRGLSVYNPASRVIDVINESNGLLSNEATDGHMIDSQGTLQFGSVGGVTIINRYEPVPKGPIPRVVISSLHILGKSVTLPESRLTTYRRIELPYRYNNFTVGLAVLDFADPGQNLYSVQMVGVDEKWGEPTHRNYLTYSGLPPGDYTLRIRGAGSRGNWNTEGISLPIRVLEPWWRTGEAYASYVVILFALILVTGFQVRKRRQEIAAKIAEQAARNQELEERVRERTSEIEDARRIAELATGAKSIFMAKMSHEIRTPLNGISGMLKLLARTSLNSDQERYVEFTRVASENLFNIVNDVLDFERIMAGRLVINPAPFSMSDTINFVMGMYAPQAANKLIDLRTSLDPELPEVLIGDRTRIIQILTNLVSNSLKYTDSGYIEIRVSVADDSDTQVPKRGTHIVAVRISVEDSGIGIPADRLGAIFEHYIQVDASPAAQAGGAGLGLSIVRQLCMLMEGDVQAESELGRGSRFIVILPFALPEEDAVLAAAEGVPASVDASGGRDSRERGETATTRETPAASNSTAAGMESAADTSTAADPVRVLVAEDEAINKLFIMSILVAEGYSVELAGDGAEALALLKKYTFDVVLMDLGMPVLGGIDATRAYRDYERSMGRRKVPIVALTAYAYKSDIDDCFAAGMDDFLSKPIDERLLFEKISRWAQAYRHSLIISDT